MAANANHWARVLVTATLLYLPFGRVLICICKLNRVEPALAQRGLLRAAVDVTGFGLLGHLGVRCRASGVDAEVAVGAVPVISAEAPGEVASSVSSQIARDLAVRRTQLLSKSNFSASDFPIRFRG